MESNNDAVLDFEGEGEKVQGGEDDPWSNLGATISEVALGGVADEGEDDDDDDFDWDAHMV